MPKKNRDCQRTVYETNNLGAHGGNRTEQGANGTLKRGTNSAAYLVTKRDAPDFAKRYRDQPGSRGRFSPFASQ